MNNLERQELIDMALMEGETLEFPTFSIKGFLGYALTDLYNGMDSVYRKTRQDWKIQISSQSFFFYDITEGDTFSINDGTLIHNFSIVDHFPNILGWRVLLCDYLGATNV